ncbi:MAG: ABC transporter substrate-binding protein [Negativicutes bacterium]|nr:ABC transporter substrate-binding protein [Negativicutes bacterium]
MFRIGILQLTQFLDDAVQGFKAGLAAAGLTVAYEYRSADGNVALLPKLASELETSAIELIFACSTPAAKAAIDLPANIPVVFTPVFDPVGAGLVPSLDKPGGKATGMAGMVPAADKVAFIRRLLPQAKHIAILYHTGDPNSRLEASLFEAAATGQFDLTPLPLDQPEELSQLGERLTSPIDLLFVPIGKIVEENFATVAYYADLAAIPVIASNGANVPAGALGALVADHHKLGLACGAQAARILTGAAPGSIPVGTIDQPDILLNRYTANNLGVVLPPDLVAAAREIFE